MENTIAKKKRAFPNTWIIIAAMVAIVAILSWIVPSGSYDYEQVDVNGTMRNVAIDGTYHVVDKSETKPTGFLGVFAALYSGCVSAADIVFVIMCCSGTFGVMAAYGYFTSRDLTKIGGLLFMALIGVIIASVVNMFLHSSGLDLVVSIIGVLVFVGLTAWDSQKIKMSLAMAPDLGETSQKLALTGALSLYLDFVNLFLYLLRFFGGSRD